MNDSRKGIQAHFNVFLRGAGHHAAAWKHPASIPQEDLDLGYYANIARIAERGLFDALFTADNYSGLGRRLEPYTLLSALAGLTKHVGLIATVSTTYNDPYHVARKFASLDHISKGRAAWNIVTGHSASDAANFGRPDHPDVRQRYARGREFVQVTKQLWDSWEEDALVYDREAGKAVDEDKVYEIDFLGEYYSVKGPLNIPRPPQGYPVLVQAGSSEGGRELAAESADVIFTAQQTLGAAQEFYKDVKRRLARYGRTSDQLLIMPGLSPIVADTEAEARDIEDEFNALLDPKQALRRLSGYFTVDLTEYPLDAPVPVDKAKPYGSITTGITSRQEVVVDAARRDGMTLRQFLARSAAGHGHVSFTGSVLQTADFIERWLRSGGADGFNILPHIYYSGFETFVDKVIPELQNRGLFRTAYEGRTLRENLGLARPDNGHKAAWALRRQAENLQTLQT
ncbi:LLM class flavin-dependent oxidoreductase [Paenibacillus mucilaginosus]|uniref:FMNH2-dependent monooxygenase n=1 Tax=Paenibacillus mucilaginosus (strain KNP414) TaxID=1036673 RepID=F8F9B7_PAEMK|nr:LLM class flavin-dependent oxidoreductase [Paenibacillus mucilaginosus]AEI43045.1 FMNH2-dependent monooxygenase [Paenibacillus mucilaginosus KNP414]MCG7215984.1 LLM class flavin-dependent oxidoreductase [Paenibacillus mucilaginosus]WDM24668.1 LLM class flavin-dependent oxidoreductase [Paenibacillus mucilaginosus]